MMYSLPIPIRRSSRTHETAAHRIWQSGIACRRHRSRTRTRGSGRSGRGNAGGIGSRGGAIERCRFAIDFTGPHAVLGTSTPTFKLVRTWSSARRVGTIRSRRYAQWSKRPAPESYRGELLCRSESILRSGACIRSCCGIRLRRPDHRAPSSPKKDKPSGTAIALNNSYCQGGGKDLRIDSIREGEVMGDHGLRFSSPNDMILLSHSVKSRRGFADGAVRAAELIHGKTGFYDFKDIFRSIRWSLCLSVRFGRYSSFPSLPGFKSPCLTRKN